MSIGSGSSAHFGPSLSADGSADGSGVPRFAGVDAEELEFDRERYVPMLVKTGHFVDEPSVPDSATPGSNIQINGVVGYDNIVDPTSAELRVKLESPALDQPQFQHLGDLGHGDQKPFEFVIQAPNEIGTSIAYTLYVERNFLIGGWNQDDSSGPHRTNVVSQSEQAASVVAEWGPFVGGGAGVGFLTSQFTATGGEIRNTVAGAGVGAGAKVFTDMVSGINVIPDRITLALLALIAIGGAAALAQLTGALAPLGAALPG